MKGKCLCGKVEFELSGAIPDLYQCHCSLCRKVSGSSSNAALVIGKDQFHWIQGQSEVSTYQSVSGFKSHFCSACGCPLPNLTRDDSAYWIPVGLLEETAGLSVGAQIFVGSKAHWDIFGGAGEQFDEMPDSDTLDRLLEPD